MTREQASARAIVAPKYKEIGGIRFAHFSGGHMIICQDMDLNVASGDKARIAAMDARQQTRELLTIGALLAAPQDVLEKALWEPLSTEYIRSVLVAPVLFQIGAEGVAELIKWVGMFFGLAQAVQVDVEKKPDDSSGKGPEPLGK